MRISNLLIILPFIICSESSAVTFNWAVVGNPGNAGDTEVRFDGTTNTGAVDYVYRISRHEVTNAQYAEFLNAVDPNGTNSLALYHENMATDDRAGGILSNESANRGFRYEVKTGRENYPVTYVSFFDAMRFVNWLHKGQGSGDTETGAYTISDGFSEARSPAARFFIPSEDEWYKAAYHKNDGVTGNYWDYPTGADIEPYSDDPASLNTPDDTNVANMHKDDGVENEYDEGYAVGGQVWLPPQNRLTDVGAYALASSPYGTFDQGGNLLEWNERIQPIAPLGLGRGSLGGSYGMESSAMKASSIGVSTPNLEYQHLGFRVAAAVPEPTTSVLALAALCLAISRRRGF